MELGSDLSSPDSQDLLKTPPGLPCLPAGPEPNVVKGRQALPKGGDYFPLRKRGEGGFIFLIWNLSPDMVRFLAKYAGGLT